MDLLFVLVELFSLGVTGEALYGNRCFEMAGSISANVRVEGD